MMQGGGAIRLPADAVLFFPKVFGRYNKQMKRLHVSISLLISWLALRGDSRVGQRCQSSSKYSHKMPPSPKKQKVAASGGFFSEIPAIKYEGPDSTNPLAFKYYDPEEVIMGKKMKDWCRFAVCFWHTWRGMGADIFGLGGTMERPWDQGHATELDAAMNRVDVHFEFCKRLGIEYYCFHE